jgi:hypothetical protein
LTARSMSLSPPLRMSCSGDAARSQLDKLPGRASGAATGEARRRWCFALIMLAAVAPRFSLPTVMPFDDDWRFTLGSFDESQGELPSAVSFDDSQWRWLSVPHDWSIEDLAPRKANNDVFECRNGTWLFMRGGANASWQGPALNDSGWLPTTVPSDWRKAAKYTDENAFGWFRRHIDATSEQVAAASLLLALGAVSKRDITYLVAGPSRATHTHTHTHTHIFLASRVTHTHTHTHLV